jgi:hypothetical protein
MLQRWSTIPLAIAAFALLSGCAAPGPTIRVNADPGVNVSTMKTFNFFNPLGTDRSGYESLLSQELKSVTTAKLTSLGYQLSDNPDFLVNFGAQLNEQLKVTSTPAMGPGPVGYYGYYGYRTGFYDPWYGYNNVNVDQYTEGTLNIDIVQASTKRLVWESVAVGKITAKVRDNIPAAVQAVVPQMLSSFPPQGGGMASSKPAP